MSEEVTRKEAMPVLGPNGLTQDYYNYVLAVTVVGKWLGGGISKINEHLRDNPIPTYTEAYPESTYENVVTSYNRSSMLRLNELVQEVNSLGGKGKLTMERWDALHTQIYELLYGKERYL